MIKLDTHCTRDSLSSHKPVCIEIASSSPLEEIWNELVQTHHYLGYRKLLGRRLKYIAFIDEKPVAALSWSAAARKLHVRDRYIGWDEIQRRQNLHHVISNSRFLIPPWVKISNLASHVLSLNIKRLNQDWIERFGFPLWMLETFVDPQCFQGTLYKASNWTLIGQTAGFGKQGAGYIRHGRKKEVYVYVLDTDFRKHIGCEPKPYRFPSRPPPNQEKLEALKMILRDIDWHPEIEASLDLENDEILSIAEELVSFHEQFHDSFKRIEQTRLGLGYLQGLLSNCDRKSVEPIALNLFEKKEVRALQRFMQNYRWDQECMEKTHQELLAKKIAVDDGMITLDPSEFPKKGKESVGVARQYCGRLGKVDNCQSGVFVGYSGKKGYGLLACQLYMPEKWFSEEYKERRGKTLVPEELVFQTKHQIALGLIDSIAQRGLFPAKWLGCDAAFGADIDFLKSIPEEFFYFASIHSDERVFVQKPEIGLPSYKGRGRRPNKVRVLDGQKPLIVKELAKSSNIKWEPVILGEGAKGPIVAKAARLRVYRSREDLPDDEPVWLFLRKNADGQIKYAVSNAPEDTPFSQLCEAAIMRWPIEQCFQEAKSNLGMGQYEHRSWPAWHRHMLYVFLGLHFLLHVRLKLKKNDYNDGSTGEATNRIGAAIKFSDPTRSYRHCEVSHQTK
ncbi:MAG: IS701 family transposase [Desulfoferrobacter sp.]